jgi:hypothetical protein
MGAIVRAGIFALDTLLRRVYHVQEFTQAESCLLRIAFGESDREITLSDGTRVHRGEPIIEIHFWNERIPLMPREGPDLGWGMRFYRQWGQSLHVLAAYIESDPRGDGIKALRGETAFARKGGLERYNQLLRRAGFDFVRRDARAGKLKHFREFWDNFYVWALIWAFNPGSLRGKDLFQMERCQVWISREALIKRYGSSSKRSQGVAYVQGHKPAGFPGPRQNTGASQYSSSPEV